MGEHILVVGGGRELPRLLREHRVGVRTSLLCQLSLLPSLEDVGGHERVLSLRSDAPRTAWVDLARTVHAADPITGIATFGERDQGRAAEVGAALGIRTHAPRTIEAIHDKRLMRRMLAAAGIEEVITATLDSAAELASWLRDHDGAWIVKPLDGSGSAGVSRVDSASQAEAAYRRCVGSAHTGRCGAAEVLVEEYLEGPQVSVESFSEGGEHCVVAIVRKYSDPDTLVEVGHVVPAGLDAALTGAVERHVPRVLDALGVHDGVCHTELVLTTRGPRVIETHLRPAGDEIPYLVRDATGVDLLHSLIRQILGECVLPEVRRTLAAAGGRPAQAVWFGVPPCAGTLLRVDGADDSVVRGVPDGGRIEKLRDSDSRPLWARADGPDPDTALARARATVARCVMVVAASPVMEREYL
jgi:predicted ATP-grasp superfamily ATP-dependent carboligase